MITCVCTGALAKAACLCSNGSEIIFFILLQLESSTKVVSTFGHFWFYRCLKLLGFSSGCRHRLALGTLLCHGHLWPCAFLDDDLFEHSNELFGPR